jgi:Zn-dependent peptidase ImmA (M78 family)
MFKQGKRLAKHILIEMLGEYEGRILWNNIRWIYSGMLPKDIYKKSEGFIPKAWAGMCCPMTDGTNTIIINKNHHNNHEEIAFTIGHELAHALQNLVNGIESANHDDFIFEEFKCVFSQKLDYEPEGF